MPARLVSLRFLSVFLSVLFPSIDSVDAAEFGAYYTRRDSGQSWERYSRTGDHSDVVVRLSDSMEFVFWRASSYRPFLKTSQGQWSVEELIKRKGDGPKERPDKNNIYSFVRIIENKPDHVLIHWRYFYDFSLGDHGVVTGGNVEFDGVVHEYFKIKADGSVLRTVKKGTPKYDDWVDENNSITQTFRLTEEGINDVQTTKAQLTKASVKPIVGAEVTSTRRLKPVAWWSFNDALSARSYDVKDMTQEMITGRKDLISGHKSHFKKGVSGTALGFDGYYSKVQTMPEAAPKLSKALTVEAWVSPGAYSICKWTAIAHHSQWIEDIKKPYIEYHVGMIFDNDYGVRRDNEPTREEEAEAAKEEQFPDGPDYPKAPQNWGTIQIGEELRKGYFLGIDEIGRVGFKLKAAGEVHTLRSESSLNTFEWAHVAGCFGQGKMQLYINSELVASKQMDGSIEYEKDAGFMIGKNDERIEYVSKHVVRPFSTFPSPLGFDGLIDEVKVYNKALSSDQIKQAYLESKPGSFVSELQPRRLPRLSKPVEAFGAQYTHLKYHDLWDNMWREPDHPDIVVGFDKMPTSVVFWRGSRSPGWVTERNQWLCDQSSELVDWHWDNVMVGAQSCCEHMSDVQARHSHVRILENTDARVVVHWRYASVDVLYKHPNTCRQEDDWGVWTDEYLTIYPDGVGVRSVNNYDAKGHLIGPEGGKVGFHDTQFFSAAGTMPEDNIHMKAMTFVMPNGKVREFDWSETHPEGAYQAEIAWINFRSDYKVFEVFPPGTEANIWAGGEKTSYSKFSMWNHYPVTQAPCDGRFSIATDRISHSSLVAADNIVDTGNVVLYGFTNQDAKSLVSLAKSWNHAPKITKLKRAEGGLYDKHQRSYVMKAKGPHISFDLNGAKKNPIVNPCFVIKHWSGSIDKVNVKINGKRIDSRIGTVLDTDGKKMLLVWVEMEQLSGVDFEISQVLNF